jgi:hypothetical protein
MHGATLIEKETIEGLKFVQKDILTHKDEILHRKRELERASTMGNTDHTKVKLIFETKDGLREVETTIWAVTEQYVTLKGHIQIPIHAIKEVILY